MIVRSEWQIFQSRPILYPKRKSPLLLDGWLVIGSLSVLFCLWLSYHRLFQPIWLTQLSSSLADLLNLLEAAGGFTIAFLWFSLLWRQWHPIRLSSLIINIDDLQGLDPVQFEQYVAQLFREKGNRVTLRGRKGDLGVDLELTKPDGKQAIVQCKRYHNTVGPKIVRELYGTLIHEQVAHAFLVTTADISDAAREWAKYKPITLIDGEMLVQIATALGENGKVL